MAEVSTSKPERERYSDIPTPRSDLSNTPQIQRRLLGAQSFPIERLSAIFPTLTPHTVPPSVDIQAQIATLTSLRLLIKATSLDPLDGSAKWKVNIGWEYIRSIARSVKFDIEDYLIE